MLIVFAAVTCYGLGKTFFWPTTLGVVSEQFPKGGALTLSAVAGVGMISVGVLGNPLLGTVQDKFLDQRLAAQNPALHEKITEPAQSKYGLSFQPLDKTKIAALSDAEKAEVENVRIANNQATLAKVAVLPAIMFLCYCGLLLYFKSRGGYRQGASGRSGKRLKRHLVIPAQLPCLHLGRKVTVVTKYFVRERGTIKRPARSPKSPENKERDLPN